MESAFKSTSPVAVPWFQWVVVEGSVCKQISRVKKHVWCRMETVCVYAGVGGRESKSYTRVFTPSPVFMIVVTLKSLNQNLLKGWGAIISTDFKGIANAQFLSAFDLLKIQRNKASRCGSFLKALETRVYFVLKSLNNICWKGLLEVICSNSSSKQCL